MRMGDMGITAAQILNTWDEAALELILRGFGEEKNSRRIAKAIIDRREALSRHFAPSKRRDGQAPATSTLAAEPRAVSGAWWPRSDCLLDSSPAIARPGLSGPATTQEAQSPDPPPRESVDGLAAGSRVISQRRVFRAAPALWHTPCAAKQYFEWGIRFLGRRQ